MASNIEVAAREYVKARLFPGAGAAAIAKAELDLVEAVMETDGDPVRAGRIRALYQCTHLGDDHPEADEDATVSEGGDNGAYVHTWSWVPFGGTDLSKECDDCDKEMKPGEASKEGLCDLCRPDHRCTRCGQDASGGEGWNGLCGNCADREESMHGTQAEP